MTPPKRDSPTLVVRRVIPVARERVFDAWLDPTRLARFMRPSRARSTVEVDPRVGGRFRITMHHPGDAPEGVVHSGEYLLIERPSRLVFTWQSTHTDNRATTVAIDFIERDGGTEVVLTHTQLPPGEIDGHRKGWTDIIELIESAA